MPSRWINDFYEVSVPLPKVLSVGTLSELVSLRHAVLEGAGFQVFSTSKLEEALFRIENGVFGVLLLCYSVDTDTRIRLAKEFRDSCPKGRIVAITNQPMAQPPTADAFVYGGEDFEALIAAVRGEEPTR